VRPTNEYEAAAELMVEAADLARVNRADLLQRIGDTFVRRETRLQAGKYVDGLLSDLPRKNGWTLAEHAGDRSPSTDEFLSWFGSDVDCVDYLEWLRWPDGFRCPHCGDRREWRMGDGRWCCASCEARTGAVRGEVVEDLVGGLDPHKWLRVGVPGVDPCGDVGFEVFDAAVAATAQFAAGQFGEPPLDDVEPTAGGGGEMQVEPGMCGQPALIAGVLFS
jgi:Transposase zinc-ribbon domain